ncbi:DUF2264 domain-containing protein [Streptomyces sp. H10-C2]|uniref:DUF2264 domain-containing protein n=1 Tax=unclassified Streptomyces TaxID=2593676 RepID=UPI0024BAE945|nr:MULTISPECIES: DUF2264 domain-containing protein [unclassified Streptomyces]MDJ0346045.1 DUF2264 domain-containing protein [Streptomyces sp. PH10-H1]MDJ0372973.1 DUF2264 domain-containing protein [Streptomyces sp. H10-C2]
MTLPPFLQLPPTDRVRSPRTGWTRAHWEAVADRMLDGLVPYASHGFAQYRLPGRNSWSGVVSDGLEGYARSFLLAAFRIAGAGGEVDQRLIERYAAGLAAGTDPDSGESWPALTDCSQQMVEAASVAIALHETRPWIWDRLDERVQARVVDWFSGFVGHRTHENNWRLFQVVSEQFLASVGAPFSQSDIDGGLDRIEDWYVGDGWYSDGDGRNFDYYIGWAMHLYPLLWARIAGERDGERAKVYKERLAQFLSGYPHFFGSDGAPVHQGRSLTYRFAAVAPVWMGALADATPLEPGLTRRLGSGVLRHFVERGVPDERGLLSLGWYEPFLPTTQGYSGPASPYWASKGFLGLLLPADHPVWTERELALPVEESDQYIALPAPGWLLHGTKHDGIVRLVNHGSDHYGFEPAGGADDPHYAQLGYSTRTAPNAAPHAWERRVDSHLALVAADGTASRRGHIHPLTATGRTASSWHTATLPAGSADKDGLNAAEAEATAEAEAGYRIETTSVLHGPWELRVHRVEAPAGVTVREGGYAVAGAERPQADTGRGWALARTADGLTSALVGLYGWDGGASVHREVEANAFGPHSAVPCLSSGPHPGGSSVHVTLVALAGDTVHPQALREAVAATVTVTVTVTVDENGDDGDEGHARSHRHSTVRIAFPDGTRLTV